MEIVSSIDDKQEIVESESDFMYGGSGNCFHSKISENMGGCFSDLREEKPEMIVSVIGGEVEITENRSDSNTWKTSEEGLGKLTAVEVEMDSGLVDGKKRFLYQSSAAGKERQEMVENKLDSMSQPQNPVEAMSSSGNSESFLAIEEKQHVVESELGTIHEAQTNGVKLVGFQSPGESMQEIDGEHGLMEIEAPTADNVLYGKNGCGECTLEVKDMVGIDGENFKGLKGTEEQVENSLHITGEREIPVILSASVSKSGNDCGKKGIGFMVFGKISETNVKKDGKDELLGKNENGSKKRSKAMKKVSDTNGKQNVLNLLDEAQDLFRTKGDGSKRSYSRNELETLRFVNVEQQKKMWNEIYNGLGPVVSRELDNMADSKHHKQGSRKFDHHQRFTKKKEAVTILSEVCSLDTKNDYQKVNPLDLACGDYFNPMDLSCGDYVNDKDSCNIIEEECGEDGDSDIEFDSIQRPAFFVQGEPDFDSGPPQDGFEYLRRVRWEASHIPKVKVAKLDRSKLNNDQTVYMPKIPDIARCPEHLLPLKQWEDAFLMDFSELRLALSRIGISSPRNYDHLQPLSTVIEGNSCQHLESSGLENSDDLKLLMTVDEEDPSQHLKTYSSKSSDNPCLLLTVEDDICQPLESCSSKTSGNCQSILGSDGGPALSVIIGMDSVSRALMLKSRIGSLQTASSLSRNDCAWLFALCMAVDTPLDPDMAASLRCLLRKCASLRAKKYEADDEVAMLNMLVTISGRYFGQLEN